MKLQAAEHSSRPWRIHELTEDFRLEDVWALPTPGGPDDFPRLLEQFASGAPPANPSRPAKILFALRFRLGELLGWDTDEAGAASLRDRLPSDLEDTATGAPSARRFTVLYQTDDEWAAELANRTVHGVVHLSWVPDGAQGHRGQMAVLVKPNGVLGRLYMLAIRPFRYLVVYPAMMRGIAATWRDRVVRSQ